MGTDLVGGEARDFSIPAHKETRLFDSLLASWRAWRQSALETSLSKVSPHSQDSVLDVIFVHGLGGHPETTWKHEKAATQYWPHWIALDIPRAQVWTLGYPTDMFSWLTKRTDMSIQDRAGSLLDYLRSMGIGARPVIFICHSLGGIMIKQMLQSAAVLNQKNWQTLYENTKGVIFLGTPHNGSSLASAFRLINWGSIGSAVMRQLESNDPHLRSLHHWYKENCATAFLTKAFHETGRIGGSYVVDPSSADPGIYGCVPIAADGTHLEICKPKSRTAVLHVSVTAFIQTALLDCHEEKPVDNAPPREPTIGDRSLRDLILFDDYTAASRPYYIDRREDTLVSGYAEGKDLWLHGASGFGKTAAAKRYIDQQKSKSIIVPAGHFLNLSPKEFIEAVTIAVNDSINGQEACETPRPIDGIVSFGKIADDYCEAITKAWCAGYRWLLIDDLQIEPERNQTADSNSANLPLMLRNLTALHAQRYPSSTMSVVITSIGNPVPQGTQNKAKFLETFAPISFRRWRTNDIEKTSKLIARSLSMAEDEIDIDGLLEAAVGSPRFVKTFYRQWLARRAVSPTSNSRQLFAFAMRQAKRQLWG